MGNLTPLGLLASEPAKILMVRSRISTVTSIASVTIENAFYTVSVLVVLLTGTWCSCSAPTSRRARADRRGDPRRRRSRRGDRASGRRAPVPRCCRDSRRSSRGSRANRTRRPRRFATSRRRSTRCRVADRPHRCTCLVGSRVPRCGGRSLAGAAALVPDATLADASCSKAPADSSSSPSSSFRTGWGSTKPARRGRQCPRPFISDWGNPRPGTAPGLGQLHANADQQGPARRRRPRTGASPYDWRTAPN